MLRKETCYIESASNVGPLFSLFSTLITMHILSTLYCVFGKDSVCSPNFDQMCLFTADMLTIVATLTTLCLVHSAVG